MITANEIRSRFLAYFEKHGHTPVASSPLIPSDDPTLLFTNAGMVPFKKVFLGQDKRGYNRATSSQKCVRAGGKHNDLENVGRTARHHTFFEMLGNFSFGEYFKKEAIRYAWDFLTKELGLPKEKLYITIYLDDDEAFELWQSEANVPTERIFRLGEKDNFWMMGDTGPCGPCTEIHIDQGEDMSCGPDCGIGKCDCDRFLEIWNLVFMQYEQMPDGSRVPLPKPNIDTGMGLERIAAICQGVRSNYDTDLFQAIITHTATLANVAYKAGNEETDTALRVISDHCRAMAFMITDGIQPSNEGRGYVLRRLIRRAYRFGRVIGLSGNFLGEVVKKVIEEMGEHYKELHDNAEFMLRLIGEEEIRFDKTLDRGEHMLEEHLDTLTTKGEAAVGGEFMFKLYDTYGFPVDIVRDIAEKRGLGIDEDGFTAFMKEQKQRAKAAWKGGAEQTLATKFQTLFEEGVTSHFTGYASLFETTTVHTLMDAEANKIDVLEGEGYLVAPKTPFYGESGGQVGDTGTITGPNGKFEVIDTVKPFPELTVHKITALEGNIATNDKVILSVAENDRLASARNHTTTHMLHAALRSVLGDHVKQQGSLVGPERFRFDFTHISAITPEELTAIEEEVNRMILANITLNMQVMPYQDAVEKGAMALFGEKYEDNVRVVSIPGESIELCGGTHLGATGQAGSFYILSESGIAAGVRRIEAVTGFNAMRHMMELRGELNQISGLVKAKRGQIAERVKGLQKDVKGLKKDLEKLAAQAASNNGGNIMDGAEKIGDITVVAQKVNLPNVKALRDLMDDVRSKLQSGVACLVFEDGGKVSMAIAVSKDLQDRFKAGALIKEVAAEVGGSGGGRPDMAQAGGNNPAGIDAAFAKLKELLSA